MAVPSNYIPDTSLNQHFVQFYESDAFLLNVLSRFIGAGLSAGETCFVVATEAHHIGLVERLTEMGVDVQAAESRHEYLWLDAAETLAQFMVDGMPAPEKFAASVGKVIEQAARGKGHLRIFGEMVALLCAQGNLDGAIQLEELWNDLHATLPDFSLFCAYPIHIFDSPASSRQFREICQKHAHVIPAESYSELTDRDEQQQAIAMLQHRANGLEIEIAQREEVEQRLRVSEEALFRLAAIVESSNDAIVSKTLDGIITSWNAAAERLFGYSAEEAVGKHITLIIPPELYKEEEEIIAKLRKGIRIQHFETVRVRKDGTRIEVSLSISPVKDRTGKIIGAAKIARDISERRELERRKDAFIGMASHELKTPVTALKGFTQLLQRRFLRNGYDEETRRFLARMNSQLDKLTILICDMLDLSRMQTGQLKYRMEPFDLAELLEEIAGDVQGTTQTHHILLEQIITAPVYGDRDRIGQVFINLLTNAIKYSRKADQIIVRMVVRENTVEVSVQDFGIGISPAYHQSIFERFYQVAESAGETYPGLGIGLYIVREIVKRHQGTVTVESAVGQGATFVVSLPLYSA